MSRKNNSNNLTWLNENSSVEFETLLNNLNEWQNNSTEATRHCLKHIYNIIRYQQKKIENLEKQKATKNELSSGLNIKANITDIMRVLNEVAQNLEQRPTKEEIQLLLEEKVNREEINDLINNKPSFEEIKKYMVNEDFTLCQKKLINELSRSFVNLKDFGEIMNTKANKDNVINLLNQKANKTDLDIIINDVKSVMSQNNKITEIDGDLDRLIDNIKKQFNNVNNIINNLTTNKLDIKEIEIYNKKINEIKERVDNINISISKELSEMNEKINLNECKFEEIQKIISTINNSHKEISEIDKKNENDKITNIENKLQEINDCFNKIKTSLNNKISKKEIELFNNKFNDINDKLQILNNQQFLPKNEINNIYQNLLKDIQKKFNNLQNNNKEYLKKFDNDIMENLDKKINIEDLGDIISQKINEMNYLLDGKTIMIEINSLKNDIDKMSQNNLNKLEQDSFADFIQNEIIEIKNDLMLKSNIKEMMGLIKNKADIDDVNKALNQIHDELDRKLFIEKFEHAFNNQNKIISALFKENIVGKWLWESGITKNSYNVPWEIQVVNTSPENFIWNKDTITIVIKDRGIYLLNLAFFVQENSSIQLIINGESIFGPISNNKINFPNTFYPLKESITGITLNEFISIEEKSRITISYSGSDNVKGIMYIKQIY